MIIIIIMIPCRPMAGLMGSMVPVMPPGLPLIGGGFTLTEGTPNIDPKEEDSPYNEDPNKVNPSPPTPLPNFGNPTCWAPSSVSPPFAGMPPAAVPLAIPPPVLPKR